MKFDRKNIMAIRPSIEDALQGVFPEHSIDVGIMKFSPDILRFTVQVNDKALGDGREMNWKKFCGRYGFLEDDLGLIVKIEGDAYEIYDVKPSSTKYPIVGKRVTDGARFKLTTRSVLAAMGRV